MADIKMYEHWVGKAFVREPGLGHSHQESAVDMWVPTKAPDGTPSLGTQQIPNEIEVFHKVINFKTKVGGLFTVSIGADVSFQGAIEYFKSP